MKAAGVTGTKAGFTAAEDATAAQTKNIRAVEGAAASTEKFARTASMAERGMGTFARGAAQTAVMMGSAGMGLAKFGAGIGKQAYSLVGGNPLLLGAGGIAAAYMMGKAYSADTKSAIEPMTGFATPMLEAAGLNALPGAPTAQAADAVSKAQTMRQAYRITPTEAAAVRGSGFQPATSFEGKTSKDADEIEASLAANWEYGSKSPAVRGRDGCQPDQHPRSCPGDVDDAATEVGHREDAVLPGYSGCHRRQKRLDGQAGEHPERRRWPSRRWSG